jgi:hypothetical protein
MFEHLRDSGVKTSVIIIIVLIRGHYRLLTTGLRSTDAPRTPAYIHDQSRKTGVRPPPRRLYEQRVNVKTQALLWMCFGGLKRSRTEKVGINLYFGVWDTRPVLYT